jgi:hypothetical protein
MTDYSDLDMDDMDDMDEDAWAQRRRAADDARHCKEICLHTAEVLLGRDAERQVNPDLIVLLQDCAEANQAAENFLARASTNVGVACNLASEICEACAEDCERQQEDGVIHDCAEVCRDTMESLRRIGAIGA